MLSTYDQQLQYHLEQQRILSILGQHAEKNFVQRILYPENQPTLPAERGQIATHKMAWTMADGRPIVYPTVVQNQKGALEELTPSDAVHYALQSGEFIPASDPAQAEWLSSALSPIIFTTSVNYKKVWDINGKKIKFAANLRGR